MDSAPGLVLIIDHEEGRAKSPISQIARVLCKRVFDVCVGTEIAPKIVEAAALVSLRCNVAN